MNNKNEFTASSWTELMDLLFLDSWNNEIHRFRSPYAFRGIPEDYNKIITSLVRLGGDYIAMEKHLMRNFRKYAHKDLVEADSIWNWLSLAKHYDLPTRLLDWSFSPLVALHFCTANTKKMHLNGAVWAVNYRKIHSLLPSKLKRLLNAEGSDVFTIDMLSSVFPVISDFKKIAGGSSLLFFEPPSIDNRIINQYALFSVMSDPSSVINEWIVRHDDLYKKIIIPASLKWEIRDKLDQLNITERVLFPGLEGLIKWLKRQYSPAEIRQLDHPGTPAHET